MVLGTQGDDVVRVQGVAAPGPGRWFVAVERAVAGDVDDQVGGDAAVAIAGLRGSYRSAPAGPFDAELGESAGRVDVTGPGQG